MVVSNFGCAEWAFGLVVVFMCFLLLGGLTWGDWFHNVLVLWLFGFVVCFFLWFLLCGFLAVLLLIDAICSLMCAVYVFVICGYGAF